MDTSTVNRVVLVLKSSTDHVFRGGGAFSFKDVELLAYHFYKQWKGPGRLKVYCLWDKVTRQYELTNGITLLPMAVQYPKWWAKMNLFHPYLEPLRPFLFVDLDTLIVGDLKGVLPPEKEHAFKFITIGKFTESTELSGPVRDTLKELHSGVMWIPANNAQVKEIWARWALNPHNHMARYFGDQDFIRGTIRTSQAAWQEVTNKVGDFKPKEAEVIEDVAMGWKEHVRKDKAHFSVICLHGKPKMDNAAHHVPFVKEYIRECFPSKRVTIIIPYKANPKRIWLQQAIDSVPDSCQLLVSEGPGNWPQNFNKVLHLAEGEYIKYLHDDDYLTPNCIEDSIRAIEEQGVDFIHGNSLELDVRTGKTTLYRPPVTSIDLEVLLKDNIIHSPSTMYHRRIFEKIGSFNESPEFTGSEEYEFNLRCLYFGFKLGYCDSTLAIYRRHPHQLSYEMRGQLQPLSRKIAKLYSNGNS